MITLARREFHLFQAAGRDFLYLVPSAAVFALDADFSGYDLSIDSEARFNFASQRFGILSVEDNNVAADFVSQICRRA